MPSLRSHLPGFLAGVAVGTLAGLLLPAVLPRAPDGFVLTRDLTLSPQGHAFTGVIRSGATFQVVGQKADVLYLRFDTAVTSAELVGAAKCAGPCDGTPWDKWDAWRRSQPPVKPAPTELRP